MPSEEECSTFKFMPAMVTETRLAHIKPVNIFYEEGHSLQVLYGEDLYTVQFNGRGSQFSSVLPIFQ